MTTPASQFSDVDNCVDEIIRRVGKEIVLGAPLGLGKPNQLVNALYRRAKDDSDIQLKIFTALSLEKPRPKSDIEARFLVPFVERLFGDYEELEYMKAIRSNSLPDNITVSEFYFKAGAMKGVRSAQCHYVSSNYTFAVRDMIDNGINVLVQLVAEREIDGESCFSLSSNTDTTLDLIPVMEKERAKGRNFVTVAQIHDDLPFMLNKAIVSPDYFDLVVRNPEYNTTLFAPPNMSVPPQDFMAGFYASTLVPDGGTLQIGIGSLGDAIVYACKLRHEQNDVYQKLLHQFPSNKTLINKIGGDGIFEKGLYGSSEMFVNGFMHLIKAGIVKRKVYDDLNLQQLLNEEKISGTVSKETLKVLIDHEVISEKLSEKDVSYLIHWGIFKDQLSYSNDALSIGDQAFSTDLGQTDNFHAICQHCLGSNLKNGIYMHGGFFLGPQDFYQTLREMPEDEAKNICMSSIGHINQLDYDFPLLSAQRKDARFINTGMMVTLSGAVCSDGLEDGTVVSGVGGQYNFVAMAHSLPDARSILCIRSTRGAGKETKSNIVHHYGHITIPRHLRDIIVTEYGITDLRGKNDAEIVKLLLNVADSRFQQELLQQAKEAGKIEEEYVIPAEFSNNTPESINQKFSEWRKEGYFPAFPLGTDLTDEEIALGKSLRDMKTLMENPKQLIRAVFRAFTHGVDENEAKHFLERMQLEHPNTAKETLIQHLLLLELEDNGYLKAL